LAHVEDASLRRTDRVEEHRDPCDVEGGCGRFELRQLAHAEIDRDAALRRRDSRELQHRQRKIDRRDVRALARKEDRLPSAAATEEQDSSSVGSDRLPQNRLFGRQPVVDVVVATVLARMAIVRVTAPCEHVLRTQDDHWQRAQKLPDPLQASRQQDSRAHRSRSRPYSPSART
jgi:hypothetical protein